MKSRALYGSFIAIVALILMNESVADNGYKWTCKHGSEKQICLMSDNIECTCIDLSSRCSEVNRGSDDDGGIRINIRESQSSSSSHSSGQTSSCTPNEDIFDCCIQDIECQNGKDVCLLVKDDCRECFLIETTTTPKATSTEAEGTTSEATTTEATTTEATTTEATTTEEMTTVTTTEATTTEAITTGPIFSELGMVNFPSRLKRKIDGSLSPENDIYDREKRSSDSSSWSDSKSSYSSSSGEYSDTSSGGIKTPEVATTEEDVATTEATTSPPTTELTTTEAITVGPIFTELAMVRDPVIAEAEARLKVDDAANQNRDDRSDSSSISRSYSESGDGSSNGQGDKDVKVSITIGNVTIEKDDEGSKSISSEKDGYSISIDISRSGTTKTNSSVYEDTTLGSGITVCGDGDPNPTRCPTVTELLSGGCTQSCLIEDENGCPACNCSGCLANDPPSSGGKCNCGSNQECLRIGRFGLYLCSELLSEGERCDIRRIATAGDIDDDGSGEESSGTDESSISESSSSTTGRFTDSLVTIGCKEGLSCTPVNSDRSECKPVNSDVSCNTQRFGLNLIVSSGEFFLDVDGCMRCLCQNGQATACEPIPCIASQQAPLSCNYQGQTYRHGERFQVDCNLCGCSNGNVHCTQVQCEAEHAFNDKCRECMSEEINQVCGNNGLTYPSSCAAMNCGGLSSSEYIQGSCPTVDVCSLHLCEDGEMCVPTGGVTCLAKGGCDSSDLRMCVDLDFLVCEDKATPTQSQGQLVVNRVGTKSDTVMCATNGVTYPSLCRLLQDTGNEVVAHTGDCNRDECQGGMVCGSDGVTYENKCVLRTQSANARVDFYGKCDTTPGLNPEDICSAVRREKKCAYNSSNCRHLVKPEDGCCEICGGIVFVAIDLAGLGEYISVNPRLKTLDALVDAILESGFVTNEAKEKCEMEVSLTINGNIQISLSTENEKFNDSAFCNKASEELAAAINDPSSISGGNQTPDVLQFARAAITAETGGINGASTSTKATSSFLTMFMFAIILFAL